MYEGKLLGLCVFDTCFFVVVISKVLARRTGAVLVAMQCTPISDASAGGKRGIKVCCGGIITGALLSVALCALLL